ncbi:MAG: Asp-tRNA(Asn)/Glu-tRNA(Gln) amidotransferase subunit GatC [Rickettsiales bacterium]|nr:Asp-tRNA(Asn)/Glu-tRNA(Gln) amidotransferase subunit GatC [Rickettsiales bacterium]
MSNVTSENIKKVARLAKIEVLEADRENLAKQVGGIIGWVEQLNEVNTDNVEPLTNIHGESLRLNKDVVADGGIAEDVLKNSKDAKYGYFAVPKVIE